MSAADSSSIATRFKVGIFTLLGLLLIGGMTVFVNDKPHWWRPCQLVHISVDDGTGLKAKSPIRSLGIEIGFLKTVDLSETRVDLGICITAPVEVLPTTRAYLRGEGFLGDKFVELKPVKYTGVRALPESTLPLPGETPKPSPSATSSGTAMSAPVLRAIQWFDAVLVSSAEAAKPAAPGAPPSREIPVGEGSQDMQKVVNRVDDLVKEMTNLTTNLKDAINPEEMRSTMKQLNRTLENASRTLSPEGGLNQTAQRTLAKLEDAVEQMRDQLTRMNKGEGSVGMLLNDPSYADEIRDMIRNANRLLSKVGGIRFVVDLGGEEINAYNGGRGYFRLQIYPKPDRYYLVGITLDPRGKISQTTTQTTQGNQTTTTYTSQTDQTGLQLTAMLGKILYSRIDLSLGAFNGDGTGSVALRLGPKMREQMFEVRNDLYTRGSGFGIDDRVTATLRPFFGSPNPWSAIYVRAGIEGFRPVGGTGGPLPYTYGAGISFDDDDIKILFALR